MVLRSKRKIIRLKQVDNLLIFKDVPSIWNWGNMYVIEIKPSGVEADIYCLRNFPMLGGYYYGRACRLLKKIAIQD
jgi:hypothetical protein